MNDNELSKEKKRRLENKIKRELGEAVNAALQDPNVVEIMLNPDGKIWVERVGCEPVCSGEKISPEQATSLIHVIAGMLDQPVSIERPIVEGIIPYNGSRFEGLLPPIVEAASYTIRKKAKRIITLDDYINQGTITHEQKNQLQKAIIDRDNLLIAGGTGSGKTTLANAIIHAMSILAPSHRIITLEDTQELSVASKNVVPLFTSDFIDMSRLLKITMRMRPDRIIPGEVRDGAALDMLKAWNTGHPGGLCTLHANSINDALTRLEQLVAEVTLAPMSDIIKQTIDTIIYIKNNKGQRYVEIFKPQ